MPKNHFRLAALTLWITFASITVMAQSVPPRRQTPLPLSPVNWATVNDEITRELRATELGTLAKQTLTLPAPANPNAYLRKLAVLVRADYPQAVQQMLRSRPRFLTTDKDWGISMLAMESGAYENGELARRLCELFPEQTDRSNWFDKWANVAAPQTVDSWLAARGQAGEGRWFTLRLKFRGKLGTEKELLAPLEAQVRAHPDRLEAVETYLQAVHATEKPQDTVWLADVVRPRLAVENFALGGYIGNKAAVPIYERALSLPFTPQDADWYAGYIKRMHFAYLGPNFMLTEAQLRQWTKSSLLRLYQETGQAAKAQKLLEEIVAQRQGGVPNTQLAFQAGQVQANSGARVVEQNIKQAEPERQDTAEYWLSRGLYYSGRKEDKQAVEAFEKGLALAPLAADGRLDMHWRIVTEYARHLWLRNPENPTDAFAFVRKELEAAPLNSDIALGLVVELINYDQRDASRLLSPEDAQLWAFISAQKDWNVHGRMLLEKLLRNAPAEQREAVLQRAEKMAKETPTPERSQSLGTLMNSLGKYDRAVFWIEDSLDRYTDKTKQQFVRYDLWRAYAQLHNWRSMLRLLPQMEKDQTVHWMTVTAVREIAIAAAESGAKEEAVAYFEKWANQDRRAAPSELYPFPSKGFMPMLRAYYQKIAQNEPQSATPSRVWKMIGK